jgi:hypothetical protein
VFEALAVGHLAMAEEVEPAVANAVKDPNVLLDTIRKLALRAATADDDDGVLPEAPRSPGQLVKKTASAYGVKENAVQRMKRMCQEKARQLP